MDSQGGKRLRRALGAGLCGAGLVLAGVLGATDGSTMPPADPGDGGAAVQAGLADGNPVPSPPHTDLADGNPVPAPPARWSQR